MAASFDHEAIYQALFNRLTPLLTDEIVTTLERDGPIWTQVPPELQPAIYLNAGNELVANPIKGGNAVWTLFPDIEIYVRADVQPERGERPSTLFNKIVGRVIEAMLPDATDHDGPLTLGGLVQWCVINGTIERGGIILHPQLAAAVPLEIRVL